MTEAADYHIVVQKIKDLLTENGVVFETFEHEPVRTSEEAAKIRTGYTIHQGAKAIIVKAKSEGEKRFMMFVIPADLRFDSAKLKALGITNIRFATEEEVSEITGGVLPGGVPPFGNLFELPFIVDKGVLENERIVFNAGDRRFSIAMRADDYARVLGPRVEDIT